MSFGLLGSENEIVSIRTGMLKFFVAVEESVMELMKQEVFGGVLKLENGNSILIKINCNFLLK